MMFNPCDPCCGSCQITVSVLDLCNQPVKGAYVTITQLGQTKILDSGYAQSGQIVLKPNSFGFFTITVTYPTLQTTTQTIFACDPCNCLIPNDLDIFSNVNFAKQGNYFNNIPTTTPEPPSYRASYGPRPTLIPKKLTMAVFDSKTGTDSTDPATASTINLPDTGYFSQAIAGTRNGINTNFYFYVWFTNCKANVMMIDISTDKDNPYAAGAASGVVVYTIGQCASPCICPYIPQKLTLTSTNPNVQNNATLTYQNIPPDISNWLGVSINQQPIPQVGWFSNEVVPAQPGITDFTTLRTYTLPSYRYYFYCNTFVSTKYTLVGLPLNGQAVPILSLGRNFLQFSFTTSHDTYNGNGLPVFPSLSCNPFIVGGFVSYYTSTVQMTISGTIDGNAIRIPDFVLSTIKNGSTYYIWGTHAANDLELDKSGSGGGYS